MSSSAISQQASPTFLDKVLDAYDAKNQENCSQFAALVQIASVVMSAASIILFAMIPNTLTALSALAVTFLAREIHQFSTSVLILSERYLGDDGFTPGDKNQFFEHMRFSSILIGPLLSAFNCEMTTTPTDTSGYESEY